MVSGIAGPQLGRVPYRPLVYGSEFHAINEEISLQIGGMLSLGRRSCRPATPASKARSPVADCVKVSKLQACNFEVARPKMGSWPLALEPGSATKWVGKNVSRSLPGGLMRSGGREMTR